MKSARKVYMPRKCEICGKMFVPPSPGSKFCSRECRAESERRRNRRRYAESHLTAEEKETKKRVKEDTKRREAADKRLTIKAGADPREYARKQTADTIEKFARIELPRTEDEEEKHMEKFNPAEIIKASKERAPEELPVPTEVKTIERLERENANLRQFNDELTAQLAQYENGNVTKADAILILKVALRMLEA